MLQQHAVKLLFQQRGRPIINQTMLKHNQSKWNHGESLLFMRDRLYVPCRIQCLLVSSWANQ